MIDFTSFTFLTAQVFSSFLIILLYFFIRTPYIFNKISIYTILTFIILCACRLIFPVQFFFTLNIRSKNILPIFFNLLNKKVFNTLSVGFCIFIISFIVTLFLLSKKVRLYKQIKNLYKYIKTSDINIYSKILADVKSIVDVSKDIKISVNKKIHTPIIFGYYDPVIILPDIDFTENELKCILIHEIIHYKYKHLYIKLFAEILTVFFWWNPCVYLLRYIISNILEFHTDKILDRLTNQAEKREYLNAIIKVIDNSSDKLTLPNNVFLCLAENDNEYFTEQRFNMLTRGYDYKKKAV